MTNRNRWTCLALVAACSSGPRVTPVAPGSVPRDPATAPRLVVLLVVDQLPLWSFQAKLPHLSGGFARLVRDGELATGVYPTAATITAPNHALLGTGQPPARSGILGNSWWDRTSAAMVHATDDPADPARSSAARLRVPGLGDALAAARTGGKAVAVALKARSALLSLGHHGTAVWYDSAAAAFTSPEAPWLAAYEAAHPVAARLRDVWTPLEPARLAALAGVPDDAPGEVGDEGFGPTFPHDLGATPQPAEAMVATPLGNELVFDRALAAIAGEKLGTDAATDLLVVSLGAHDYVGHAWGHESWEAWDMLLRLDAQLGAFLAALDERVGRGRWAIAVTSDHGAAPLPVERITFDQLLDAANRAAVAELGPGEWVASAKYPAVYLTAAALAQPRKELVIATRKIMNALRSFPGIARVGLTADHAGRCETRTGDDRAICEMLDPERSGEIFYVPRRQWIVVDRRDPAATAHGSLHAYDREVPLLLAPRVGMHSPVAMTAVAPLLARWLGVPAPANLPR